MDSSQAAASDSKTSAAAPPTQDEMEKNLYDIDTQNLEDFLKGFMETQQDGANPNDAGMS